MSLTKSFSDAGEVQKDLLAAAKAGNLNKVRELASSHVDLNCYDEKHRTPISLAAEGDHFGVVQFLVMAGADSRIKDYNGLTAIDYARKLGPSNTATADVLEDKVTQQVRDRIEAERTKASPKTKPAPTAR